MMADAVDLPEVTITNPEARFQLAEATLPAQAYPETPPWVLEMDHGPRYYITTSQTWSVEGRTDRSILTDKDALRLDSAYLASSGNVSQEDRPPPELLNPITYWRRNYYGVFSAHLLTGNPTQPKRVVAFLHGENKNERVWPGIEYPNTVLPSRRYSARDYSGYNQQTGNYEDAWHAYFGFIGMAWCPLDERCGQSLMAHDEGPVIWPSTGYLTASGRQATRGVRHPSSIIHEGFIYLYYLECGDNAAPDGRQPGMKCARAPVSSLGKPGSFICWFRDGFREPSLPNGFQRLNRRCLHQRGGRSSRVIDTWCVRFTPVRLEGTPWFLGVEERQDQAGFDIYLRLSRDLVHWSSGTAVPGARQDWASGYHYPIALDQSLRRSDAVRSDGFWLAASHATSSTASPRIALRHMALRLPPC